MRLTINLLPDDAFVESEGGPPRVVARVQQGEEEVVEVVGIEPVVEGGEEKSHECG